MSDTTRRTLELIKAMSDEEIDKRTTPHGCVVDGKLMLWVGVRIAVRDLLAL